MTTGVLCDTRGLICSPHQQQLYTTGHPKCEVPWQSRSYTKTLIVLIGYHVGNNLQACAMGAANAAYDCKL